MCRLRLHGSCQQAEIRESPAQNELPLVHPFGLRDPLVDGLASGKALLHAMPVSDSFFSQLPAEQNGLPINFTGKIKQADIEIFHLNADGIDFRKSIFHALFGLGTFGFFARKRNDIEEQSARQENAMLQRLLPSVSLVHGFLGGNGRAQEGLEYRQQQLSLVQRKSAF